jgi:hypothetical protein
MYIGAVDADRGFLIIAVQVGKETLKNVLLDEGFGVKLIIEEESIWLGLPAPYQLRMAD